METVLSAKHAKYRSTTTFNRSENRLLPSWEQLRDETYAASGHPTFSAEIQQLRANPRKIMHKLCRAGLYLGFRDPSWRKFLDSSWEEIVDIIASQVAENHYIDKEYSQDKENLKASVFEEGTKVNRTYMQQPCTSRTVHQRADFAEAHFTKNDAILLLGDDDMVGVELATRGFNHVTVVDIDPKLINRIANICDSKSININLFVQDLSKPIPFELKAKDYSMVILDPFYSIEGIELFMSGAKRITENSKKPCFFLCVHLLSLMRKGLSEFSEIIEDMNLELTDVFRSFNLYPIPVRTQKIIHIVNKILTKSESMSNSNLNFFTSDALILRNRTLEEPPTDQTKDRNA